ncbi:uncharacterized protein LOC114974424 [Acropora millepora]|uniref:uncharacterized protein LOC114974424 n=1 Tax=Acropora millepora TaxID=45264 RepID=UPI001CF17686|nr:uncharacterized protein LOC114974424 [Acropora millepora]
MAKCKTRGSKALKHCYKELEMLLEDDETQTLGPFLYLGAKREKAPFPAPHQAKEKALRTRLPQFLCKTPTPCLCTHIGLLFVRLQSLAKMNQQQIKTEFDSDELPDEVPIAEESNYHNNQMRTPHQQKHHSRRQVRRHKAKPCKYIIYDIVSTKISNYKTILFG